MRVSHYKSINRLTDLRVVGVRVCSICETSFHSQAVKKHMIIFTQDKDKEFKMSSTSMSDAF